MRRASPDPADPVVVFRQRDALDRCLAGVSRCLVFRGARGDRALAPDTELRNALLCLAVILLWVTLDWPVGPLGAGYLMWVHAAQFILLAMVLPPVFLLGLGDDGARRLSGVRGWGPMLRALTDPLPAMLLLPEPSYSNS